MLAPDLALLPFPVAAERGIGQKVVVGFAFEAVLGEAVAEPYVVVTAILAHFLHQHVGGGGGVGALVVVLPVYVEPGIGMMLAQVDLRLGQHAAGSAGRVEQLAYRAASGEEIVVVDEQYAHHEADHLARREVVAGGLVGEFIEPADQVLEDQTHLFVRHLARVQIHPAELRNHHVEDVRLAHLLDLGFELEVFEDAAYLGGEPLEVAHQMLRDVVGIPQQPLEIEIRVIVESLACCLVEHGVQHCALVSALALSMFGENAGFGGRQHTVEATQHRHREHDSLVPGWPVGAAQKVGDLPNQVGNVTMVGHRNGRLPNWGRATIYHAMDRLVCVARRERLRLPVSCLDFAPAPTRMKLMGPARCGLRLI